MIVFFSYKKNFLSYTSLALKYFKYEYVVLNAPDEKYFKKACVIIPVGIKAQIKLKDYPQYKHKFLISSEKIYETLDDKILFYKYVKKHNLLDGTGVKLIPTYDNLDAPNKHGEFIIKQKDGAGSKSNKIKHDDLHKLIKKYADDHQIQDIIDIKYVYSINCLCAHGELLSSINFIITGYIEHSFYEKNKEIHVQDVEKQFEKVIKNIVKDLHYSGLMEIEFIVSENNEIYLMECNPRVSSNMLCMKDDETVPFNEVLFYPYVKYIHNETINPTRYKNKTSVLYCGEGKLAEFRTSNDSNVVTVHFNSSK